MNMGDARSNCAPKVLLLKSIPEGSCDEDPYLMEIRRLGIKASLIPTLDFNYKNLDRLYEALDSPNNFHGFPRCVAAVIRSLKQFSRGVLNDAWKHKCILAIGDATSKLALDKLGLSCAKVYYSLLSLMLDVTPSDNEKPYLIPCSNLHDEAGMSEMGIQYVEVYDTIPHPNLQKALNATFSLPHHLECLVFFSPSGVDAVLPHISDSDMKKLSFVAIGGTTATALLKANISARVCCKPTIEEVTKMVKTVLDERASQ